MMSRACAAAELHVSVLTTSRFDPPSGGAFLALAF